MAFDATPDEVWGVCASSCHVDGLCSACTTLQLLLSQKHGNSAAAESGQKRRRTKGMLKHAHYGGDKQKLACNRICRAQYSWTEIT